MFEVKNLHLWQVLLISIASYEWGWFCCWLYRRRTARTGGDGS